MSPLIEPAWAELLPGSDAETVRVRATAAGLWRRVAPTLARSVGLVGEQQVVLEEYCVTVARVEQGERALARDGVVVPSGRTDRGMVRNPWTTVLNQYRAHYRAIAAELGLTPSSSARLSRPVAGEEEDPFD